MHGNFHDTMKADEGKEGPVSLVRPHLEYGSQVWDPKGQVIFEKCAKTRLSDCFCPLFEFELQFLQEHRLLWLLFNIFIHKLCY